ncbi:MAG TPA: transcriptional repressor [Phycisphaerales bacterium]|nr:transcriptional repressor [Phycisphaerales bacterium]
MAHSVRDLISSHGLRCTAQREQVYAALLASKVHPTAEELHDLLNQPDAVGATGGISLATVYNTLDVLTRHGLARRIAPARSGASAAFRYDADTRNHAHVVLPDGGIRDLPDDLSERVIASLDPELLEEVRRRTGGEITRIGVEFDCRAPTDRADRSPQ